METISTTGVFRQQFGQAKRCRGNQAGKKTLCAGGTGTHTFLTHNFLNYASALTEKPRFGRNSKSSFQRSVSNICDVYGMDAPDLSCIPFPFYIERGYRSVEQQLSVKAKDIRLQLFEDSAKNILLATWQGIPVKGKLYYLPVFAVYNRWTKNPMDETALLSLSLFSYCYKVLGVPYHTEYASYVMDSYMIVDEWFDDYEWTEEEETAKEVKTELKMIQCNSRELLKELKKDCHLEQFEWRVANYKGNTKEEQQIKEIAADALDLYKRYPNRSLMATMMADNEENKDEYHLDAPMFISFYWGNESPLVTEGMDERLNSTANESGTMDIPGDYQYFDGRQDKETLNFDFAKRAMALLDKAGYPLYRI